MGSSVPPACHQRAPCMLHTPAPRATASKCWQHKGCQRPSCGEHGFVPGRVAQFFSNMGVEKKEEKKKKQLRSFE